MSHDWIMTGKSVLTIAVTTGPVIRNIKALVERTIPNISRPEFDILYSFLYFTGFVLELTTSSFNFSSRRQSVFIFLTGRKSTFSTRVKLKFPNLL